MSNKYTNNINIKKMSALKKEETEWGNDDMTKHKHKEITTSKIYLL